MSSSTENPNIFERIKTILSNAFSRSPEPPPAGQEVKYRTDAMGRKWPEYLIQPLDLARDDMMALFVGRYLETQAIVQALKLDLMTAISVFIETARAEYSETVGGEKGNVSFLSFDGVWKLQRKCHKQMAFNEQLRIAMALIDDYLSDLATGAPEELKLLVRSAFMTDESGNISVARALALRKFSFPDDRWRRAMEAIVSGIVVSGSVDYFNLYKRNDATKKYELVPMDFAAL
ncbi:MAG: DUF3164 family protein [Methylococcaceae bacterium]|nr:MAG: DUF3164 family protein [Methylococcaceae bacterium]